MNTLQAIKVRTSYRGKYKDSPVSREDLTKIMEAGLAAPSGCNQQTTSLIAVDDPKILERLHNSVKPFVGRTAPAIICRIILPLLRICCLPVWSLAIKAAG